jgi:hypothetical protein
MVIGFGDTEDSSDAEKLVVVGVSTSTERF